MSAIQQRRVRVDIGRVVMTPLCLFFILISLNGAYRAYNTPAPPDAFKVAAVSNALLVTGFYVLMVAAYLLRSPARMTGGSLLAKIIAVVATFLPFSLALFRQQEQGDLRLLFIGSVMLVGGLILSLWSLFSLGKNLSLIPQARSLVEKGPYVYVRHPLYVGEILSVFGLVISRLTLLGILVPLILAAFQTYRAIQEEKILANAFPEYHGYMSRTRRFLPGVY